MSAFLFHPGDRRKHRLVHVAGLAGVPIAEVIRRMIDHAGQPQVLDALFPHCSGKWEAQSRADFLGAERGQ